MKSLIVKWSWYFSYNSIDNRTELEYNNTKSPLEEAKDYMKKHLGLIAPEVVNTPPNVLDPVEEHSENFQNVKYTSGSSFRHKGGNQGLIRDFGRVENRNKMEEPVSILFFVSILILYKISSNVLCFPSTLPYFRICLINSQNIYIFP